MNYIEGGGSAVEGSPSRLPKSKGEFYKENLPKYRRYDREHDVNRSIWRAEQVEAYISDPLDQSELLRLRKYGLLMRPEESRVELPGVSLDLLYSSRANKAVEGILTELKGGKKTFCDLIKEAGNDRRKLNELQFLAARVIRSTAPTSEEEWRDSFYRETMGFDIQVRLAEWLSLEIQMAGITQGILPDKRREMVVAQVEKVLASEDISDKFRVRLEKFLNPHTKTEVARQSFGGQEGEPRDIADTLKTQEYLAGMGMGEEKRGRGEAVSVSEQMVAVGPGEVLPEAQEEAEDWQASEVELEPTVSSLQGSQVREIGRSRERQRAIVEQYAIQRQQIDEIYVQAMDLRGGYDEHLLAYLQREGGRGCEVPSGANIRERLGSGEAEQAVWRFFAYLPNQMQRAIDVGRQSEDRGLKGFFKKAARFIDYLGTHQEVFGFQGMFKAIFRPREAMLDMLVVRERVLAVFEEAAASVAEKDRNVRNFLQAHAEELRLAQVVEGRQVKAKKVGWWWQRWGRMFRRT